MLLAFHGNVVGIRIESGFDGGSLYSLNRAARGRSHKRSAYTIRNRVEYKRLIMLVNSSSSCIISKGILELVMRLDAAMQQRFGTLLG